MVQLEQLQTHACFYRPSLVRTIKCLRSAKVYQAETLVAADRSLEWPFRRLALLPEDVPRCEGLMQPPGAVKAEKK